MSTNSYNSNGTHSYHTSASEKQMLSKTVTSEHNFNRLFKNAIWAYFFLLIFEGALRKWVLPGLATPLLIIRDPIALWVVFKIWQRGLMPSNFYLTGTLAISVVGFFYAILLGHGNLPVALFGARILVLHFPLMFVIGHVFNRDDVLKIGKALLWIAIPMSILTALQFYSPQSAWVNRGVGGDLAGAGFSGAAEFFRPPGTFSFTNGLASFYGLLGAFIVYYWLDTKRINRWLLIAATIALLIAIPLSISRGLFFQIGVSIIFGFLVVSRKPEYIGKFIIAAVGFIVVLLILSKTTYFQTAIQAFTSRFEVANEMEGGLEGVLVDRYLGGLIGALFGNNEVPFLGYGIGMGTNVGAMLLSGGTTFLISEGEWGRLIGELGPLMGMAIIFFRLSFSLDLAFASYHNLVKGNILPWMLLSYGLLTIPQSQWSQPTSLGFSTLIGGLILAAFHSPTSVNK